ncbi:ankyrin repeat domain-containing protein [Flavobacterium sp.]|uniref:ankyrin repeat domain-containing protein n=1 Tax=Flavobacterium sp. TaxID=239 RepID=UPI00352856D5
MTPASTFQEAIQNKRFLEAEDMINRGDDLLKSQFQFKLADTFSTIIKNKAYHVINALIEKNHIEMDIFEYDNFKNSIFESLVLNIDDSQESIDFLENFIPEIDNLNDNLQDDTWLSLAFRYGAPAKVVAAMINSGCDVQYKNNKEESLIQVLIATFHHRLTNSLILELLELAIQNGVDVNHKNKLHETALHYAISQNKLDVVEKLLENGADANIPSKQGKTPYYLAIIEQFNDETTQKMAAFCPPDFGVETGLKTTLLYDFVQACYSSTISESEKNMFQFFADNGADIATENINSYGETETVIDCVASKNFEFFDAFFDIFPLDVNATDNHGNTILHKVCAINVNFDEGKAKDIYRKVKKLINLGADKSITNTQDKTPVDLASDDNLKEKTVALLLKN